MYDLVSIGDITVDLFFKDPSLTTKENHFYLAIGGKYTVSYFHESLGGGGANVAVGAAKRGLATAVIGAVGENAFKQMIIQKLVKKTVSSEFLMVQKEYLNISAIFLNNKGERTIVHHCPPHTHFTLTEDMAARAAKTKMLYIGNLPGVSTQERKKLLRRLKTHKPLVCLNLGSADCRDSFSRLDDLINEADIFILNAYEFAELIKKNRNAIDFLKNCASFINYDEKILVVTDGENGSYAYHRQQIHVQKAILPPKMIDTTGAGDAYTSGFLASYGKEKDLQKAMREGASSAAEILGRVGAQ